MEYKLENPVRVSTKVAHTSLYQWFIEEMDIANKKVGPNCIPWGWSLHFNVSNLTVVRSLEFKADEGTHINEAIRGKLYPLTRDWSSTSSYSFFGTNRKLSHFTLRILKSDEGRELFHVSGSPSYVAEIDFRDQLQEDFVEIEIILPTARFDRLADFIDTGCKSGIVTLGEVSGFYSEWSPSISTNFIKILSNLEDQKAKIDPSSRVKPPVLGEIGSFSLQLDKGAGTDHVNTVRDEDTSLPAESEEKPSALADTGNLEKVVLKLAVPAWIIVGILLADMFL